MPSPSTVKRARMIKARLDGAAEIVAEVQGLPAPGADVGIDGAALPPPPPGDPATSGASSPAPGSGRAPKSAAKATGSGRPKPSAPAKRKGSTDPKSHDDGGLADDVKDIGVGFAKDMLTTADGRLARCARSSERCSEEVGRRRAWNREAPDRHDRPTLQHGSIGSAEHRSPSLNPISPTGPMSPTCD